MVYATELTLQYRNAMRTLWNNHFWPNPNCVTNDAVDSFNTLKLPLFNALVADRLGPTFDLPTEIFGIGYQLIPKLERMSNSFTGLKIDVGFDGNLHGNWQNFPGPISKTDLRVTVLDFFDWDCRGL